MADSGLPMISPELYSLLENLTGPNETGWTPLMSIRGLLSYLVLDLSATSSDVFLLVSNAVFATSVENHRQNTEIIQIITQIRKACGRRHWSETSRENPHLTDMKAPRQQARNGEWVMEASYEGWGP